MGYYMIFQYGENKFLNDCKKSGVSGIICAICGRKQNFCKEM